MMCSAGVPQCAAGTDFAPSTPVVCSMPSSTASAGYSVLALDSNAAGTALGSSCALTSSYKPSLFSTCSMTKAATLLSVFVDYDCSVQISPIGDATCSEPGASGYSYANLTIQAAYSSLTTINPVMPSANAAFVESFLLSLTNVASDGQLTLSYWAASTNPADASSLPSAVCSGTVDVTGGQVANEPAVAVTACPDGSYAVSGEMCPPCPVGSICSAGSATQCAADSANPLLGQSASGDCAACSHADGNAYTSAAGSDYCTVPWLDNSCGNGTTWDSVALACADCPAGTKRGPSDSTCLTCAAGTYAAAGATSCTACAANTVAPSSGSSSCTACPLGSVAVSATSCSAW